MNTTLIYPESPALSGRRTIPWFVDALGVAGLLYAASLIRLYLPFTPAPVTLQTLVVLGAPFLLGRDRALAGVLLYLVLGLAAQTAGASLFAAASTATYGYLLGFCAAPVVMHFFPRTAWGIAAAMAVASALILATGTLWLQFLLGISFTHAAALGAAPFLAGDLVKLGLAYKLVLTLEARRP